MGYTNFQWGDNGPGRAPTKEYKDGWDRIYGKKSEKKEDKPDESKQMCRDGCRGKAPASSEVLQTREDGVLSGD